MPSGPTPDTIHVMQRCPAVPPPWLVLLPWLLAGCTYLSGDAHIVVTSTPPGANVLLDGASTGKTTPIKLELDGMIGSNHDITLRKPGYAAETRRVYHYSTGYASRWIDGATDVVLPPVPLFWTLGDILLPFGRRWRYVPHELHVVLYEQGEQPVTSPAVSPVNPP